MSWRPCSPTAYVQTPIIQTSERLPRVDDGPTVFAREHFSRQWWPLRWSDVTALTHAEWRKLELIEAVKARTQARKRR